MPLTILSRDSSPNNNNYNSDAHYNTIKIKNSLNQAHGDQIQMGKDELNEVDARMKKIEKIT